MAKEEAPCGTEDGGVVVWQDRLHKVGGHPTTPDSLDIVFVATGREDDNRDLPPFWVAPDDLEGFSPGHHRHHQVQKDEVEEWLLELVTLEQSLHRRFSSPDMLEIIGDPERVHGLSERAGAQEGVIIVVLDKEDALDRVAHGFSPPKNGIGRPAHFATAPTTKRLKPRTMYCPPLFDSS